MPGRYRIISADSHLEISPNNWTHWVPARWRDQAPRVVKLENGQDAIVVDGGPPRRYSAQGVRHLIANVSRDQLHLQLPTFEEAAGAGSPEQRLREQEQDGVDAEVLFSSITRQGQIKEREGVRALNHAYNQYLAEQYRVAAPDRLIPMGVIPTSGIDDALDELEYCARVGMKGIALERFPSGKGYPTAADDRFWAACLELHMPVTHHTLGGSTRMARGDEPLFDYTANPQLAAGGRPSADPVGDLLFRFCGDAACAPIQMAFGGVFDRFPDLQVYWAETMAGWIEYALFQIDDHYDRYKYMAQDLYGLAPLRRKPSEYLVANNMWGFLYDPVGVAHRHAAGVEKIMWGSDFPHVASDWPDSATTLARNFEGVSEEERYLMVAGNAIRFFHLDD
jgi:predicted TIM-barrel fold metal-dependent hydrolase